MIVDTSVLLQILFDEAGAEEAVRTLASGHALKVAAPTVLETEIVFGARAGFEAGSVQELLDRLAIEIVPFGTEHLREAKLAYARFGKGRGHPARLNLGDCVSYALARVENEPLAFKGTDFAATDIDGVRLG